MAKENIPYNPKLKEFARQLKMILPSRNFLWLKLKETDVWI
jgi:hypothetical protein